MEDKRTRVDHRGDDAQVQQSGGGDWSSAHDGGGLTHVARTHDQLNQLDLPGGMIGGMKFR